MIHGVLHGLEHDLPRGFRLALHLGVQLDDAFAHGVLADVLGSRRIRPADFVHALLQFVADLFHVVLGGMGSLGITENFLYVDVHHAASVRKITSAEKQRCSQNGEKQKSAHNNPPLRRG